MSRRHNFYVLAVAFWDISGDIEVRHLASDFAGEAGWVKGGNRVYAASAIAEGPATFRLSFCPRQLIGPKPVITTLSAHLPLFSEADAANEHLECVGEDEILLREFFAGDVFVDVAEHQINLGDEFFIAGYFAGGACGLFGDGFDGLRA